MTRIPRSRPPILMQWLDQPLRPIDDATAQRVRSEFEQLDRDFGPLDDTARAGIRWLSIGLAFLAGVTLTAVVYLVVIDSSSRGGGVAPECSITLPKTTIRGDASGAA